MKRPFAILLLAVCLPAAAQNFTASLQVKGDVRVGSGSTFVPAVDRQPVVAGQRILVGENASATIRYGTDCSRTYSDPGVYTIQLTACRDGKNRQDQNQQEQQAGNGGDVGSAGGASLGSTLGTILGTVILGQQVIQHQEEKKADRSLSH